MAGSLRRNLALVGTAVAVTGGVAYAVWRSYRAPKGSPEGAPHLRQPSLEGAPLEGAEPHLTQEKSQSKQILVLGLDGAGKTSILHSLTANQVKHGTAPTEGFNAVCVSTEDSKMEFLEIGGSETLRAYWKMYLSRVLLLIYVVDSADHKRLPVAKKLLHQLVENNSTLPVMILANKQRKPYSKYCNLKWVRSADALLKKFPDIRPIIVHQEEMPDLEGAYSITDIHEALALSDIGDKRKMFLIATHVAEDGSEISSGMKDTRELIAGLVSEAM